MKRAIAAIIFLLAFNVAAEAYEARLYAMRGLLGAAYSRGVDTICYRAQRELNVKCYVRPFGQWWALAQTAKANYRIDKKPVILLGHSLGADRISSVADDLRRSGVPVTIALYYDPTPNVQPVPRNVMRAVEYRQNLMCQLGQGIIGFVAGVTTGQIFTARLSHVALDDNPGVHAATLCEIRAALAKSPFNLCPLAGALTSMPIVRR